MLFHCPACASDLKYFSIEKNVSAFRDGYLKCSQCITSTPVINGIRYFTETDLITDKDPFKSFHTLNKIIEGKKAHYLQFIRQKVEKGIVDPYSAFQPFNESSRSFYPFIETLKSEVLKPNDVILDTWCRTGWSAMFLSSMFPDQQVISVWEGNNDVLGYQGFDFWFSQEKKPKNLEIIFQDLNTPIPLKDGVVKLVHGLDTLHRYKQSILIPELIRVTSADGTIIFPHIHLTNSTPEPFFERGEKQLHGLDYDRFFNDYLSADSKRAYIVSEPKMFVLDKFQALSNDPNTSDYNALIAIIPDEHKDFKLSPYNYGKEDLSVTCTLINPYLRIDLNRGLVTIDRSYLNGVVGEMLDRHPSYQEKLKETNHYQLSQNQVKIIYCAQHHYSNAEIIKMLQITEKDFNQELSALVSREIAHTLPLSVQALKLQSFHSAQTVPFNRSEHTLAHLRALANSMFDEHPILINSQDESELLKGDVSFLITQIRLRFIAIGLERGGLLVLSSKPHFETLLTFWAAVEMGIEVCIINTGLPCKMRLELINDLKAQLVFIDSSTWSEFSSSYSGNESNIVVFDDEDVDGTEEKLFSNWLEGEKSIEEPDFINQITPESNAVILFTSGTTGKPKGIRLNHGSLYRSGKLLAETYGWNAQDRLLMISEIDSMSGLRNVCMSTQFSGTTIVIPDFKMNQQVFSLIEAIEKHKVTILSSTPALISQLIQLGDRIKKDIRSLRQVICTGGKLSVKLVEAFNDLFDIRILNYYGLTETTGLCIGEHLTAYRNSKESIGRTVDSIAQVVDMDGNVLKPGETGRLRIFNDRMMTGYYNREDQPNLPKSNNWLYTGDLATQDEEGNFYLKAREREIIKDTSGNVVYLSEVENCLISHEYVKDAVICILEEEGLEFLAGFIVLQPSISTGKQFIDTLKNYVEDQLGKSKSPKIIKLVDQFPVNNRGKLDKKFLLNSLTLTT